MEHWRVSAAFDTKQLGSSKSIHVIIVVRFFDE